MCLTKLKQLIQNKESYEREIQSMLSSPLFISYQVCNSFYFGSRSHFQHAFSTIRVCLVLLHFIIHFRSCTHSSLYRMFRVFAGPSHPRTPPVLNVKTEGLSKAALAKQINDEHLLQWSDLTCLYPISEEEGWYMTADEMCYYLTVEKETCAFKVVYPNVSLGKLMEYMTLVLFKFNFKIGIEIIPCDSIGRNGPWTGRVLFESKPQSKSVGVERKSSSGGVG